MNRFHLTIIEDLKLSLPKAVGIQKRKKDSANREMRCLWHSELMEVGWIERGWLSGRKGLGP